MQSRSLELLVGFFVCLGIAAVFVLTFRVASLDSVGDSVTDEFNGGLDRVDASVSYALGANAYITKPIQAPQVIAKVKELLK